MFVNGIWRLVFCFRMWIVGVIIFMVICLICFSDVVYGEEMILLLGVVKSFGVGIDLYVKVLDVVNFLSFGGMDYEK